jgi:uncharacterized protein (DUF2237 family)
MRQYRCNNEGSAVTTDRPLNVLGSPLQACSFDPLTGFMRTGCCETGPEDAGSHTVCARVTREFLDFSLLRGNDLVTPRPQWRFAGLKPGDRWCLCASRWLEACVAGVAPPVVLEATHENALRIVPFELLRQNAWQPDHPTASRD